MSDSAASSVRQIERRDSPRGEDPAAAAAEHGRREQSEAQAAMAQLLIEGLRANCALNYRVRACLAFFGFAAGVLALIFAAVRGKAISDAAAGDGAIGAAFVASTPVVLLVALAGIAGMAAWTVHSRGVDEMYGTMDAVSRLEREGEVAVSSRGLIYAFEEKLQNARRAFTLLLWLGRTLFIVCLGLFVAAIISLIMKNDALLTAGLGASSVIGALLGAAQKVPRNIAHNLADVVQIQTAVTGCDRQISLLETAAIDLVNFGDDRAQSHREVLALQRRMDQVIGNAVCRIERFADPEYRAENGDAPGD